MASRWRSAVDFEELKKRGKVAAGDEACENDGDFTEVERWRMSKALKTERIENGDVIDN